MIIHKPLLLFLLILSFSVVKAQRQNVYFFDSKSHKVSVRDSCYYFRVTSEPDQGDTLYNVKEFYKDGTPKLTGKSSRIDPLTLEGQCINYYISGKRKSATTYDHGRLNGDAYYFFQDGKINSHHQYKILNILKPPLSGYTYSHKILDLIDSTGKVLIADGNGHYIQNKDNATTGLGRDGDGDVKNGLKDGEWKQDIVSNGKKITLIEVYDMGKRISGKSIDENGKSVNPITIERSPIFKGGINNFYAYIASSLKYPENARRNKIQGKVVVSFVIDRDGTVTDVKAVSAPNEELGAEAVRVVSLSPKWEPGMENGRFVRVQYSVPVNFKL